MSDDQRPVHVQEFRDGTLMYVPYRGGQLGIFVSHPDPEEMPADMRERKAEEEANGKQAWGSYIDIAFRRDPEDDWGSATRDDVEGIGKMMREHVVGVEQHVPGAGKDDPHRALLAVMRGVLLSYAQGGLS